MTHKFAQKYGFKGPWDGTSKLIKQTINKLEMKYIRVTNANDCYTHLSSLLTKDETNSLLWESYKAAKSSKILQKTPWTTDCIFVVLGVEDLDEYTRLTSSSSTTTPSNHIFYIDRLPKPDIKAIPNTQKTY